MGKPPETFESIFSNLWERGTRIKEPYGPARRVKGILHGAARRAKGNAMDRHEDSENCANLRRSETFLIFSLNVISLRIISRVTIVGEVEVVERSQFQLG